MTGDRWGVNFVDGLRLETLGTDAGSVVRLQGDYQRVVEDVVGTRLRLLDAWGGSAGAAAENRMQEHIRLGDEIASVLTTCAQLLRSAQARFEGAKSEVQDAVAAARADGCSVEDSGICHPPAIDYLSYLDGDTLLMPMGQVQAHNANVEASRASAEAMARRHTDRVQNALNRMAAVDRDVASDLRSIEIPPVVAESAGTVVAQLVRVPSLEGYDGLPVAFPAGWTASENIRSTSPDEWLRMIGPTIFMAGGVCLPSPIAVVGHLTDGQRRLSTYIGGGYVKGPDGNVYPLVAPRVAEGDNVYGSDADPTGARPEDLDGADPGWVLVGHVSGTDNITSAMTTGTAAVVGIAKATGMPASPSHSLRQDLTDQLVIDRNGQPSLDGPRPQSHEGPGTPYGDPRDNPMDRPATGMPNATDRVGGALEMVKNVGDGINLFADLKESDEHVYSLSLEENEDGRRRALLRVYDVYESKSDRAIEIRSSYAYVDPSDGEVKLDYYNTRNAQDGDGWRHMKLVGR